MKNLLSAAEYAKGDSIRNNDYSSKFDPTALAGLIHSVEKTIKNIVGKDMFDDMIAVRNTSEYDYDEDPPVLLFPNHPKYEYLFENFIFYALGFEMLVKALTFRNVEVDNMGVNFYEASGFKKVPTNERHLALNAAKAEASQYRDELQAYLCANMDDYPLMDKSRCTASCGCSGEEPYTPIIETNFMFSPPSY